MGVGYAQELEHALDRAVLAERTVQCIERDIRRDGAQLLGDVETDIDLGDAVAGPPQRVGALTARAERHLAFVGHPTHQNGDVLGHGQLLRWWQSGFLLPLWEKVARSAG